MRTCTVDEFLDDTFAEWPASGASPAFDKPADQYKIGETAQFRDSNGVLWNATVVDVRQHRGIHRVFVSVLGWPWLFEVPHAVPSAEI